MPLLNQWPPFWSAATSRRFGTGGHVTQSPHRHRHEAHGVIGKNINHIYGDGVAAGLRVGVAGGGQFQVTILAGAEALPFILKNVSPGPALLEIHEFAGVGLDHAGQFAFHAHPLGHFDDFLAAFVIQIHRPIIHPVRPLFGENVPGADPVFILVCLDQLALLNELDQVALLGGGQFVTFGIGLGHGKRGSSQLSVN